MLALKQIPWRKRKAKAREWALRSHGPDSLRVRRRIDAGPTLETLVWRAKQDRRGTVVRSGHLHRGDGRTQAWAVRWSVEGRTDQYDVLLDGVLWRTGGRERVEEWIPGLRLARDGERIAIQP